MTEISVVIAAWTRGWSLEQIAFAAGVSRQAVQQRLARYLTTNDPIARVKRLNQTNMATRAWHCAACGRTAWASASYIHRGESERHFCSISCYVASCREFTDDMVDKAIDMRWAGKSWQSIAAHFDRCQQTIQKAIWRHLYCIGMLDTATVESIWDPHRAGKHHAWNWLERGTGLICTEYGARLQAPIYKFSHAHRNAWGARLVRTPDAFSHYGTESKSRRAERRRLYRSKTNGRHPEQNVAARELEGKSLLDRSGSAPTDTSAVRGIAAVAQTSAAEPTLEGEHQASSAVEK